MKIPFVKEWADSVVNYVTDNAVPKLVTAVREEVQKQFPTLIEGVVRAVAETAGQLTVNATDKITDVIPGQVDDEIIDGLVKRVRDRFKGLI